MITKHKQKGVLIIALTFIVSTVFSHGMSFNQSISGAPQTRTPTLVKNNTVSFPVNIRLEPAHLLHGKDYVPTGTNLSATAEVLDEKFRNLTLTYQWSVKNITIAQNTSSIVYLFDKPDNDTSLKLLVSHQPNDTGTIEKNLVVRDPISIAAPEGKLFLEHGELLRVSINFNGTGSFKTCHRFCLESIVKQEDDTKCKECSPSKETNYTQVNITQYLREVGNYTLIFVVDNIASRVAKQYSVKITEAVRKQTIPYLPIVSSISAVLILLIGVALHLRFKKTVFTETADFNFTRLSYVEEEFFNEELSLLQRMRYLLFRADEQDMSSSRISNSRSRLI